LLFQQILACNWVSVVCRRTLTPLLSKEDAVALDPCRLQDLATRSRVFSSIFSVALALETCTAGDSPKKFGSV
jgi:hypothetical protein